jgi:hypothetical protein
MSASEAKPLPTDTTSWWEDREQLAFMSALFATALFVFIAVSSAGDGYVHPPLITVGAPPAAIIGFLAFLVLGSRLFRKVRLLKVILAVACMAALPVVVSQLLNKSQTPPNVHNGTVVAFTLYWGLSEFSAAAFLVAALVRGTPRRH